MGCCCCLTACMLVNSLVISYSQVLSPAAGNIGWHCWPVFFLLPLIHLSILGALIHADRTLLWGHGLFRAADNSLCLPSVENNFSIICTLACVFETVCC